MFCNKCGSPLPEGANFCRVCGQASSTPAAAPTSASDIPTADVSAAAQAAQQVAYQPAAAVPTEGKALGSLISGIVGLTIFPILASIVAIVLGHMSLSDIKKSAGRLKGEGMAIAGLVMGYLGLAIIPVVLIIAAIAIPNLLRARMVANDSSAVSSVRSINIAEVSYSASNKDKGFTCDLDELRTSRTGIAPIKSGYNFTLRDCESDFSDGPVVRYKVIASPVKFDNTGSKTYCSDETGIIKSISTNNSDACLTEGVPLS